MLLSGLWKSSLFYPLSRLIMSRFRLIRKKVQTYRSARSVFSELSDVLVENALLDLRVHTGSRLN